MNIYSRKNPPKGFYVYAYIRSKDSKTAKAGTPYYIGKGKNKRAWINHRYKSRDKKYMLGVPTPEDFRIIIIETNLTEIGAFALERRLIRWHGRIDKGTGILRNETDGGEGSEGATHGPYSEERRKNISKGKSGKKLSKSGLQGLKEARALKRGIKRPEHSERMKGSGNPMYGKTREKTRGSTGMNWYTNGVDSIMSHTCPEGWKLGCGERKKPIIKQGECPHCKKIGALRNLKRYHFDNCKLK